MHAEGEPACYHCGEPVPAGCKLSVLIDGKPQAMCCPGCQAVASLIAGSGLDSFYRWRTAYGERAPVVPEQNLYRSYDIPANCEEFVERLDNGQHRARLLLGGVSCAACTWLIEAALARVPGVTRVSVNLAQQSLAIDWDPLQTRLSDIFQHLLELGYDPHPWQLSAGEELLQTEQRNALRELAVAGLAMMQVGMFAIALHAGEIQGIALEYRSLMRWVSLIIATLVVSYSARSFFRNAWTHLRHGRLVMDVPVALAIGLAYSASAWATLTNSGQVYFDSIAMFTFFLLLGRFLERRIRHREFLRQTDLQSLLPVACTRRAPHGWESVPTRTVAEGDILLLKAGDVVAADGRILSGRGTIDEAAFTGEHFPRSITEGDRVVAGTVLREGGAEMRASAAAASSRLASMLKLMSRAYDDKPALARLADRVASRFVAAVLIVATLVAAWWWLHDPQQALWVTLSVLVVSCPCALALATPAALTAAAASLRRRGLLLVGENTLETLNACNRVLFDKTGTLTLGKLRRAATFPGEGLAEAEVVELAAALEQHGNHPIAAAFADVAEPQPAREVQVVPGRGILGNVSGHRLAIGSAKFVGEFYPALGAPPTVEGQWIALASRDRLFGWVKLDDTVRDDAAALIAALKQRGLSVGLLTGDSSDAGPKLARALGIDDVFSGASPDDKLAYLQDLQSRGERVAMVGDGLNDAPVLAAADCSFAVNQATDLAKYRADAILLGNSLTPLARAFDTAEQTRRVMRQNFGWALAYNALAVPLAAAGWVPPWAAAIGMSVSSLLVVLNSLRLN